MYKDIADKKDEILLKVTGLTKYYVVKKSVISRKNVIKAVENVTFHIKKGEAFGLIGESGSGKTTLGSLILKLQRATSGRIEFDGVDITNVDEKNMRELRKDMQVVFQATEEVLDPKMTIGELIMEPIKLHNIVEPQERVAEVDKLLGMVGLSGSDKDKFPYQMSGGQRQRVGIARAIATRPRFILCDEPISALDVSVQGQILNLLNKLKEQIGLTYFFISHDLKAVDYFCDRIAVMYKGQIVEIGERHQIMEDPQNEYTRMLVNNMVL